ncbi:MAG: DEAD/DEAH box helicase [Candidatus Babeliales bacterium]
MKYFSERQKMAVILRDYQEEALNSVIKDFQDGVHHQLIVLPTASGKTFVMAAIAKYFNKRVLLVAHREELLLQAQDKIKLYWPEADIGICKAERKEYDHQIVIGSTQTCSRPRCLKQLKKNDFDILMIDETHHAPASTYQRIIKDLGFGGKTKKLLIGVTATPMRSDKKQLGDFFDKIVYSKTAGELIQAGHLSPISGRRILTSFNLNKVHTRMGDFAVNELASVVNTKDRNKFIVDKFKEHCPTRKAIVFCVDVKHCQDMAQTFNTQGIIAEPVWGNMDKDLRKRVLNSFSKANIQVVTSCGILTEGFDEPSIAAIVMARPTKSKGFYIQMAGRGLRKHPGKEDCLVLDFTDQYHNLNTVISLNKAIPEAKYIDVEKPKVERPKIDRTPRISTLEDVDHTFDILGAHVRTALNFIWTDIGDDEFSLADDSNNEIVIQSQDNGFIATVFYKNGDIEKIITKPETIESCVQICEKFARKNLKVTYADLKNPWLEAASHQPPTQPQIQVLEENKCFKHWMTKADALIKIRKIMARQNKQRRQYGNHITPKQKLILERSGFKVDNISKQEAFAMIAKLRQSQEGQYKHRI